MTRPSRSTLLDLTADVAVPTYDRSAITAGIAHIGVGGFHRSHQAVYIDDLLSKGLAQDWGIVGIGVLPHDAAMRDALLAQDCLYTVVTKHGDGAITPRVIGSIIDFLHAPDSPEKVLDVLTRPEIRIVSLTITEGGYNSDPTTGALVLSPELAADLIPRASPSTAFGFIVEALARRRAAGTPPFTVMSCDNIQGNGSLARHTITAFARLRDEELGDWIAANVALPDSMVDRITPVTVTADREALAEAFGLEDAWPVVCEPWSQWVLEDDFPTGRPPLEVAGVQVVDDVAPYELMKLRLLNAGHQVIGHLGYLAGHRYVHEAATDPDFVAFLRGYLEYEGSLSLDPVPGVDVDAYCRQLLQRFANPHVADTLARLCAESSDRIPTFLLPVIRHRIQHGGEFHRAALVVAAWARYAEGVDEQGAPIEIADQRREAVVTRALESREDPAAFLADDSLFGELASNPEFVTAFVASLDALRADGAREALLKSTRGGPTISGAAPPRATGGSPAGPRLSS
jgi:mannitol 2-dehydrogenase